jgi:hypothetical protein
MSIRNNPGTVSSNLRFAYDIADTRNSYAGEPTTNLALYSQNFDEWTGNLFSNWINSGIDLNASYAPDGTLTASRFGNGYSRFSKSISASTSTVYTFSVWLKNVSLTGTGVDLYSAFGLNGTLVSYTGVLNVSVAMLSTTEWRRFQITVTSPSSGINQMQFGVVPYIGYGNNNSGQKVDVWGGQVEQKSYATQYISTVGSTSTRSVTNSLFDISGYNASLDMSNVSFTTASVPTFDGSNDYIPVAHANSPITNKSYEMVFRPDSIPASNTFRSIWQKSDNWNGDTGISMQFIYNNFTFSYGASWGGSVALAPISSYVTAGNWYHVVGTVSGNGGSAAMYINGSLAGTGTAGTPTTTSGLTIGLGNGGSLLGDMPIFRMYSETLSAAQVQQNYLAYKKRFGI